MTILGFSDFYIIISSLIIRMSDRIHVGCCVDFILLRLLVVVIGLLV